MTYLFMLAALAQSPAGRWSKIETERGQVLYPEEAAVWAQEVAGKLDLAVRRVEEETGLTLDHRLVVKVGDPYSVANGAAFPLLRRPRTELWASPPEAGSSIGWSRDWAELLLIHELTHLVHLTQPSRNPFQRQLGRWLGLGPLALGTPRWAAEGYATVVEGRLTGLGRPASAQRAALLRGLAARGQLPAYEDLNRLDGFEGGSMAYLVGSAFLEWLEARSGEGRLRDLWLRLSARQVRTFDEAFEGLFGESPASLYARFSAELVAQSVGQPEVGLELWMELAESVEGPAVNADQVAILRRPERKGPVLQVYQRAVDEEAVNQAREDAEEAAAADPLDVPDQAELPPHQRVSQRAVLFRDPTSLSYLPDGRLLFAGAWRDLEGRRRWDLFAWDPDHKRLERLTRGADLKAAQVGPSGGLAVRSRWGRSELVSFDLERGVGEVVVEATLATIDVPRVSAGGSRAWLQQAPDGFDVMVQTPGGPVERRWEGGPAFQVSDLSWRGEGALVAVVGQGARMEAWLLDLQTGSAAPLSQAEGRVVSVAVAPDGAIFARVTSPAGHDLATLTESIPASGLTPASSPPAVSPPALTAAPVDPRRYGLGPQELRVYSGGTFSAHQSQLEFGVGLGDPIGRAEHLLLGAWGWAGGSTGLRFRSIVQGPLRFQLDLAQVSTDLDQERAIASLDLGRQFPWTHGSASIHLVGELDRPWGVDPLPGRQLVRFEAGLLQLDPAAARVGVGVRARGEKGWTGEVPWDRWQGELRVQAGSRPPVRAGYRLGWTNAAAIQDQFALGGVAHSLALGPAAAPRVFDGAWAPWTATGQVFDRLVVDLDFPVTPVAARTRLGDLGAAAGYSSVGAVTRFNTDGMPFLGLSSLTFEAGLTRQVETPEGGFSLRPWNDPAPWRGWLSLRVGD